MNVIKLSFDKTISCLVSLCFVLSTLHPVIATAQSSTNGAPDFEAPTIILDDTTNEPGSGGQSFSATVIDNTALSRVSLHYRFDEVSTYESLVMVASENPDVYSATITEIPDTGTLYYYIEATDTAGNKTFKGHTFSPLERPLGSPVTEPPSPPDSQTAASEPVKKSNKLYWVLGAVALVALAGLAGGGGDDGGGGSESNCDAGGCVINLQLTNP